MFLQRDQFIATTSDCVAICGGYYQGDSVHVGIYWQSEGERKIFHFLDPTRIHVEEVTDQKFEEYLFNPLHSFHPDHIPFLAALAEDVADNLVNAFVFRREGAYYDGASFAFDSGLFTGATAPEKYVNCAVFSFAVFKSLGYTLIDWDSWPSMVPAHADFLDAWLDSQAIPQAERGAYYAKTKALRGRHLFVSPSTVSRPSDFIENDPLASSFMLASFGVTV